MNKSSWIARSLLATVLALSLVGCATGGKSGGYPAKPIELIAAGSPGGGLDTGARMLEDVNKQEKLGPTFLIANQGGGGGNVARAQLVEKKGNDYVMVYESNRVWLNNLMGTTEHSIEQTTPIARLTTEYIAWAVKVDSPFKSAKDVIEAAKKNPSGIRFGVGTIPSNDQFNILRPLQAQGVNIDQVKITAFRSGGDLMTNLLGGHVDVISSGLSEMMEQAKAGKVRVLAVSAPKRVAGDAKDVPTWKEQGIDVEIAHWRGVFGPPGMSEEAVKYWDNYFAKAVKTKTWKAWLTKLGQEDAYMNSKAFRESLLKERETNRPLVEKFAKK
ncbi:MAG: Bug family tripartite tricarboxylate transporter substrate binding protein [Bacillota bacterium]